MTVEHPAPDSRDDECIVSRRHMLSLGAGFVLAASGLLFPSAIEEAGARTGRANGRLGGRRGKNRRGINHRKRRTRRQRGRKPGSDGSGVKFVAVFLHNQSTNALTAMRWEYAGEGEFRIAEGPDTLEAKTDGTDPHLDYYARYYNTIVELSTGMLIKADNPYLGYPTLTLVQGSFTKDGAQYKADPILEQGFKEWEAVSLPGYKVQRLSDTDTHKRFQVTLTEE